MSTISSTTLRLVATNLRSVELVVDMRGIKDGRYYCLPPYRGNPNRPARRGAGGGYLYHLVSQGHRVGTFDNWPEAQASLAGYPDSANRGYNSLEECNEALQAFPGASTFVNTSLRKSRADIASIVKCDWTAASGSTTKREATRTRSPEANAQLLADLKRYCSPIRSPPPSPKKAVAPGANEDDKFVNFAIRGGGVISSSPEQRYREMQRRSEEPDMLVTCSFAPASLFALDDDEEDAEGAAARRRLREGLPPVKPGKVGWVHGTKLMFFQSHKDDFLAAVEIKETGTFYSRIAQLYLKTYRYNTPWDGGLEDGQDVADDVDPNEDVDSLPAEEGETRAEYFKVLRG
ncbi:hypothetical protein B0H13DRAFT_1935517, partial [Mycena leptocephala]